MNILKAEKQWANRPADERFRTLAEMVAACKSYADSSVGSTVRFGDLRVEARGNEIFLLGKENIPAQLTHYSFGQMAQRVKAPAGYLRNLPPTLAAQNLNHGLKYQRDPDDSAKVLLHKNGGYLARCFTSAKYQRIWNYEIGKRLVHLEHDGWRTAPGRPPHGYKGETWIATEADCLRSNGILSVKPGDRIAPAGIYASDRDMFVFLVNEGNPIANPASPDCPLHRGFFVWNSEVGDKSFGIMTFFYDAICGNHIVWGATNVCEMRVRHVGSARGRAFGRLSLQLKQYADSSVNEDEAKILKAQTYELGTTKEQTLDALMKFITKKRVTVLNESKLNEAYAIAETTPRYGNPNTPWAVAQGITEISQRTEHASDRVNMDRAAGQLIEMAF